MNRSHLNPTAAAGRFPAALALAAAAACCLLSGLAPVQAATTYYVSQSAGNDRWDGLAASHDGAHGPWRTLGRASEQKFSPGDTLLLRRGDAWDEVLTPQGEGTPELPVTIGAYGEGPRPLIDRRHYQEENIGLYGIHLKNTGGYAVRGIEFAGMGRGVYVELDKGVHGKEYLLVEDCHFRDSTYYHCPGWEEGPNYVFATGVMVHTYETSGDICFSNITIANCTFHRFAVAVNLWSGNEWDKHADDKFAFRNLTIRDCLAEDARNWPFTIHSVLGGTIAHTRVHRVGFYNERAPNGIAGALLFRSKDMTIENSQFGYISRGDHSSDGQAFDYEGNTTRIVARNVLYHDTEGPGILMCWAPSSNIHATNVELVFENCVFNARITRSGMGPFTIFNEHGKNRAAFRNCRFYMREGERLSNAMEGLAFIDCVTLDINGPSGPNLAREATASASSFTSRESRARAHRPPSHANDGNLGSAWTAAPDAWSDQWLQLEFESPVTINEFLIRESAGSSIARFAIQAWDEAAEAWRDCFNGSRVGPAYKSAVVPVTTRKVRLYIYRTDLGSPGVDQFELYHNESGEPLHSTPNPWTTVNDNAPAVVYTGAWEVHRSRHHHQGDEHYSKQAGDTAEFTFDGTAIQVIGSVSTTRGRADVFLNGVFQETIDTHGSPRHQQTIFERTELPKGTHTVRIVVKGEASPEATDAYICIDAFQYVPGEER